MAFDDSETDIRLQSTHLKPWLTIVNRRNDFAKVVA